MEEFSYIGSYAVREVIGEGGFGKVYQAYQPFLDRQVAIKMLRVEDMGDLRINARFIEEARTIARLRHPNIVTVYEFGYIPTDPDPKTYMVMEYLPGETLYSRLTRKRLSLKEVVNIIDQLAQALDYAHQQGIIHRDLTPTNVIFSATDQPVIVDFGLAQLIEASLDGVENATQTSLKGTPAYMAPEQVTGSTLTHATDQYALAVIAYEMLSKTQPFAATKIYDSLMKRVAETPAPIADRHDLPTAVDEVLVKAMSPVPAHRYASATSFAQALGEALLPDQYRPRVVLDPLQTAELRAARQTIAGFMWGLAFAVLVIGLFCLSLALRSITNEDRYYLLWRGMDTAPIDDDVARVTWLWFDSVAVRAGIQMDDIVPRLESERYITTINGIPYNEYDEKLRSGDFISHPVMRNSETFTLTYSLDIASYWYFIILMLVLPTLFAYFGGLWMLRRWGVRYGNRLMVPILLLTSLTLVSVYVNIQLPYLDALVFYILMAMMTHFILIFPSPLPYVEAHPRVVWLAYLLVILGLIQFMIGAGVYIGGEGVNTYGYTVAGGVLFVTAVLKWGFRDYRHYPTLIWFGVSVVVAALTAFGSTWIYELRAGEFGELMSRTIIAIGTIVSVLFGMYSYHRTMRALDELNPTEPNTRGWSSPYIQ
jgi:tRNA A-37 threonylcarbamoyl transferase component Bud32